MDQRNFLMTFNSYTADSKKHIIKTKCTFSKVEINTSEL